MPGHVNSPRGSAAHQQPWLAEFKDHLREAYVGPHCTFSQARLMEDREQVQDYEPLKFASFKVFCAWKGTILQDPVLYIEQCVLWLIFIGVALPVYITFRDDLAQDRKGSVSVSEWLKDQEGLMRSFAKIMTTLCIFVLAFYTTMTINRWWIIRTQGIGGIKAATMDLEMFICQFCTQEPKVLSAIRRYSRASLMLVFIWRKGQLGQVKEQLLGRSLLDEHEVDQLLKWNHCLHETIWAWQAGIVTMLYKENKIKSEQLMSLLLQRCSDGRSAVQLIHTHLAVRIPMQYVHLLGLLVKMHNFVLAAIMGILFGAALRNLESIVCLQLFGRTLILPFLFNAILLINAQLADPFGDQSADFPGTLYEKGLEKDASSFVEATNNLPEWMQRRYSPPQ